MGAAAATLGSFALWIRFRPDAPTLRSLTGTRSDAGTGAEFRRQGRPLSDGNAGRWLDQEAAHDPGEEAPAD